MSQRRGVRVASPSGEAVPKPEEQLPKGFPDLYPYA